MNDTRKVNALNGVNRYKLQNYVQINWTPTFIRTHTYRELAAIATRDLGFRVTLSNAWSAVSVVFPQCIKHHVKSPAKSPTKSYVKLDPAEATLQKYTEIIGKQIDVAFGTVNQRFEDIAERVTSLEQFVTNPR